MQLPRPGAPRLRVACGFPGKIWGGFYNLTTIKFLVFLHPVTCHFTQVSRQAGGKGVRWSPRAESFRLCYPVPG